MHCRPMYPVKSTGVREAICTPICTPIADKTMRFCAMICDNRAFGKIIKNIVKSRLASFCEDIQSYDKSIVYLLRQCHVSPGLYGHYLAYWHFLLTLWRTDSKRLPWINRYPVYALWLLLDPIALFERVTYNLSK